MPKSQLAGLMMCTMLVQTVAAPPLSRIAKTSVRTRNRMLLGGLVPMIAANAIFATATSATGGLIALANFLDGLKDVHQHPQPHAAGVVPMIAANAIFATASSATGQSASVETFLESGQAAEP